MIETSQMVAKAIVIENSAGEVYGNGALPLALPSVSSHTDGLSTVRTTAAIRPAKPPITAPLVVQFFHSTYSKSTGKLAEAATANASETMKAMFCFSKAIPSSTAITPSASVVMRETFSSDALSALPCLNTVA